LNQTRRAPDALGVGQCGDQEHEILNTAMSDEEVVVVAAAKEGMNTRGKSRIITKKKDQVGADAAARLLETCQRLTRKHQAKGQSKTISVDRNLFEELVERVQECEKATQGHLNFDSATIKEYLEQLETNLVERINASVINKVSIAIENAHVGTEEKLAATVEKTIQNVKLPTPTWAAIASSGTPRSASLSFSQSTGNSSQNTIGSTNLRITTPLVQQEDVSGFDKRGTCSFFTRYLDVKSATEWIKRALGNHENTKEAKILGVGTTKLGYVIRFRDEQSKDLASRHEEWLASLHPETKIDRPRYGIVVHRTPMDQVNLETKREAISKLLEENEFTSKGFRVTDMAWLRRKDTPLRKHASLGIWFDSPNAVEWAIRNGVLFGRQYIGSIEPYEPKRKRCHRCLDIGHLAWNCKEQRRCAHCLEDHNRSDCPEGTRPRCADCGQEHQTEAMECTNRATRSPRLF